MDDKEKKLDTALQNSSTRVYKSTREFESLVSHQQKRVQEAAEQMVNSGLQQQVDDALEGARESESKAQEAAKRTQEHLETSKERLEEAKQLLNIATDVAWGGTYDKSASDDHATANRLRLTAFCFYVLAVLMAAGFAGWASLNPPQGWEWLVRSFIGGPVAILVWVAAYASRESREHRNSARLFKHQSLAFNSIDQYAKRIEQTNQGQGTNEAAVFLKETAQSLFTNQIDAHVDQIKTQGRTGRFALRLLQEQREQN